MTLLPVIDMVRERLRAEGFDGLVSADHDCACLVADLGPCGLIHDDCIAGHKVDGCSDNCQSGGGCDFHIVPGLPQMGAGMPKKIVYEGRLWANVHLGADQLADVRRAINLAVIGKENCNRYEAGPNSPDTQIVSDVPPEEEEKLMAIHRKLARGYAVELVARVDIDGNFHFDLVAREKK